MAKPPPFPPPTFESVQPPADDRILWLEVTLEDPPGIEDKIIVRLDAINRVEPFGYVPEHNAHGVDIAERASRTRIRLSDNSSYLTTLLFADALRLWPVLGRAVQMVAPVDLEPVPAPAPTPEPPPDDGGGGDGS